VDPTFAPTMSPTDDSSKAQELTSDNLFFSAAIVLSEFDAKNLIIDTKIDDANKNKVQITQTISFYKNVPLTENDKAEIKDKFKQKFMAIIDSFDESKFSVIFGIPPTRRRLLQTFEYYVTVKNGDSDQTATGSISGGTGSNDNAKWGPDSDDNDNVSGASDTANVDTNGGGSTVIVIALLLVTCSIIGVGGIGLFYWKHKKNEQLQSEKSVNNLADAQRAQCAQEGKSPKSPSDFDAMPTDFKMDSNFEIVTAEVNMSNTNVFQNHSDSFGCVAPQRNRSDSLGF